MCIQLRWFQTPKPRKFPLNDPKIVRRISYFDLGSSIFQYIRLFVLRLVKPFWYPVVLVRNIHSIDLYITRDWSIKFWNKFTMVIEMIMRKRTVEYLTKIMTLTSFVDMMCTILMMIVILKIVYWRFSMFLLYWFNKLRMQFSISICSFVCCSVCLRWHSYKFVFFSLRIQLRRFQTPKPRKFP